MHYYNQNITKETSGYGLTAGSTSRKKIKNYSYSLADRIGKGFSSVVYKGTNDENKSIVAIKCIDMKGVKDSISREMLQCQIEALKTLKHQNILQCFDVVKETSHCYIITQFCNEGDLGAILKKKRRFTEAQATRIIKDIVNGYIQIGEKSFLHRDLKLANIFMSNGNAKIADFGFAKKNKYDSERQKYNVGSPLYMSPEALKKNIYSQKNDIWSIGIMAYELVHGQTPWQCRTQKQLMDKMVRVPVKFRQTLNLSHDLKTFIKKCLQVDEKKRMSLDELKKWIQNPSDISYENKQRSTMPPKLNLSHKPNSSIETLSNKPLTQLTNRITHRTQRVSSVNENHNNKQNSEVSTSKMLPKALLQRNNTVVVNEINSYRLLYKIMEKMKKYHSNQTDLIISLGNQVIRKATNLKNCVLDNFNRSSYDLKEMDIYLSQSSNPSIKKYKSVVSEYFKKYTSEISLITNKYERLGDMMKEFLKKQNNSLNSSEELIMYYWMVEYISLPNQFKKQYLDGVIQPKVKLNKEYISQRIKEVC